MKFDRSIVYTPGRMVLPKKSIHKVLECPKGFREKTFSEKYKASLSDLFFQLDVFKNDEIEKMIQTDRDTFKKYCTLVVSENGELVGAIGLIKDANNRLTIGFLGVKEEYQDQGIGKYLISKMGYVYDTTPSKYPLYIEVSSCCYVCIMILARLGFTPFMGEYNGISASQAKDNWEIITKLLKEKSLKS